MPRRIPTAAATLPRSHCLFLRPSIFTKFLSFFFVLLLFSHPAHLDLRKQQHLFCSFISAAEPGAEIESRSRLASPTSPGQGFRPPASQQLLHDTRFVPVQTASTPPPLLHTTTSTPPSAILHSATHRPSPPCIIRAHATIAVCSSHSGRLSSSSSPPACSLRAQNIAAIRTGRSGTCPDVVGHEGRLLRPIQLSGRNHHNLALWRSFPRTAPLLPRAPSEPPPGRLLRPRAPASALVRAVGSHV